MFWNFCVGWRHDVNIRRPTVRFMTSLNLISNVCETRKFVMVILHGMNGVVILHGKQGLL